MEQRKTEPVEFDGSATQDILDTAQDVLKTVVITPDDSFAIFLGGSDRLTMYVAKRTEGWSVKELTVENAEKFTFDNENDAASITNANNLLISYGTGGLDFHPGCRSGRNLPSLSALIPPPKTSPPLTTHSLHINGIFEPIVELFNDRCR